MRVLVYAPGHPDLNPSGPALTAYALFDALGRAKGVTPFFLATAPDDHFAGQLAVHPLDERGREFLAPSLVSDDFYFVGGYRNEIKWQIIDLIERLEIEVLHLHHFLGLGVDTVIQIRSRFPSLKMVFSVYEFLSVCAREGRMIRTQGNELCYAAVPLRCALCFPKRRPVDFEIRREWFRSFFDCVQAVLVPGPFVAGRMTEWGLPAHKLAEVPLLHPQGHAYRPQPTPASETLHRFGFFAPLVEPQGLPVLLDAADRLRKADKLVEFHLYGEFGDSDSAFRRTMEQRLSRLADRVHHHGGYHPRESVELMQRVDWVVVPSIWWESAPLVLDEARLAGRPVLAANVGGMLEKVKQNDSGLHFPVGNAQALADTIARITGDRPLWDRLVAARQRTPEAEIVQQHLTVYGLPQNPGTQAAA